jgi:hypothetical protein
MLRSRTSPTLLSPFVNDVAKLVPIPIAKSGDLICKPVSLPRLGRLELIGGQCQFVFHPSPLYKEVLRKQCMYS